ncbi:hypothetical protein IFM89_034711 [Coptis chinensis]|uniref:Uncharacterized protein n=1 Tax=Coptis chinensis TaxID=261450 RepID=A0A835LGI8_9MAGN|nr:hypothetical protein IFM89_034711 [Coptis chinensis]
MQLVMNCLIDREGLDQEMVPCVKIHEVEDDAWLNDADFFTGGMIPRIMREYLQELRVQKVEPSSRDQLIEELRKVLG